MINNVFLLHLNSNKAEFYKERANLINEYEKKGQLVLGGNSNSSSLIIFQAEDETIPDSFIKKVIQKNNF